MYQLPFGKGKPFLSHGAVLNEVAGGWQLSGSLVLSTGNPLTVTDAQEHQTQANGGGAFPQYWDRQFEARTPETSQPGITLRHSFGTADGTYGNEKRNTLVGPGINVVNLSAHKEFDLAEVWKHDVKLQFRADATNAFNHPSFGQPNSNVLGSKGVGTPYSLTAAGTGAGVTQINSVTVGGRNLQLALRLNF